MKLKYPSLFVTAFSLLALAASANADGLTISSTSPASTSTGGATVVSSGTLTLTGSGETMNGGTIVATNPSTSTGAGTLTLTGSGGTTTGGTVITGNPGTLTGTVTVNGGGTLITGGTLVLNPGTSTGTGTVTSTGTLTLTGPGTITGSTSGNDTLVLPSNASVFTALSTSGHQFNVGTIYPPPPAPGSPMPMYVILGPLSFSASFVLANQTTTDMNFIVPRPNVPMGAMPIYVPNVVFRIYDQSEKVIWASWTNPGTMKPVSEVLPAGASWTQAVQVPLQVGGHWLAGHYVLVASINGSPEYSATASFDVTSTLNPAVTLNPVATGIKGLAVEGPMTPVSTPGDPNVKPLAAAINIAGHVLTGPVPSIDTLAVPVLHVKSDSNGHFNAILPPGIYEVTGESPNPSSPYPKSSSQKVTVTAGHMTEVIVKYDTGIR